MVYTGRSAGIGERGGGHGWQRKLKRNLGVGPWAERISVVLS